MWYYRLGDSHQNCLGRLSAGIIVVENDTGLRRHLRDHFAPLIELQANPWLRRGRSDGSMEH